MCTKEICLVAILVSCCFFVTISILHYVFYVRMKKKEKKLVQKQQGQEESMHLLVHTGEETLKWISLELHDGIAQILKASGLLISEMQQKLGDTSEMTSDLERLSELEVEALKELKRICHNFAPIDLKKGLDSEIEQFVKSMRAHYNVEISYTNQCVEDFEKLSSDRQINIYRLIQEATTNALRHSKCTEVSILVRKLDDKKISIFITDDGIGIKKEILDSPENFGMNGMKQRVLFLDGKIEFDTEEGEGTVVKIIINN